ncbi:MAG: hypothetical protein LUE99_04530 [Bacteroides sp.]|nr:hypothetical protein [Bacteroides sp.]
MKISSIKYMLLAIVAVVAGCTDEKVEQIIVQQPNSFRLAVDGDDAFTLDVPAGGKIGINGSEIPVLANGLVSLYEVPAVEYYSIYYSSSLQLQDGKIEFEMPQEQVCEGGRVDASSCPYFALTDNENLDGVKLKAALGALKLTVPANADFGSVSSVTLESETDKLAGVLQIDLPSGEVSVKENASQMVKLKGAIDITENRDVLVALPAQTFTGRLNVTLITAKGRGTCSVDLTGKSIEQGNPLAVTLDNIDWKMETHYYGTANSIIVAPGTTSVTVDCAPYSTTSLRYAYENLPGDESLLARSAKLLWNDVSSSYVSGVQLSTDHKSFTVTLGGEQGNAVIAIYDKEDPMAEDANILWSFHIWVTDVNEQALGTNWVGNSYMVLDRNLGAVSATPGDWRSIGMLYQWGRKDPFVSGNAVASNTQATMYSESGVVKMQIASGGEKEGTVAWATAHPDTYIKYSRSKSNNQTQPFYWSYDWLYYGNDALWGNPEGYDYPAASTLSKSVYDPCPEGYMVAPFDVWRNANASSSDIEGSVFSTSPDGWDATLKGFSATWNGKALWYPVGGLLNRKNGNLQEVDKTGYYWSSTPMSANSANTGYMIVNSGITLNKGNSRGNAYTVRCVKMQ